MSGLNFVDLIIIFIFFISAVVGFGRGFISEVVSLITLIAAFAVAITFTNPLATYFTSSSTVQGVVTSTSSAMGVSTSTPVSYAAIAISFAILFAGTLIIGALVKMLLNMVFQTGILGIGNSILGGAFGLVKGFFINVLLIFLIQLSSFSSEPWFQQSKLVGDFQPAITWLGNTVSPSLGNLRTRFGQTVQSIGSTFQSLTASV